MSHPATWSPAQRHTTIRAALVLLFSAMVAFEVIATEFRPGVYEWPRIVLYGVMICVTVCRRQATAEDLNLRTQVLTVSHCILPFFFSASAFWELSDRTGAFVSGFSALVGLLGLGLAGAGLLSLWDSFGVLPGHRGIKSMGVYSRVRHPIYAGYLLTAVAWTFGHPSARNVTILISFAGLTVMRLLREERLLSADPVYLQYASSTSARLIPGVF